MPVQKIISTLHKLGMEMSNSARLKNEAFRNAENANPWFTEKEILRMVDHIVNNYLNTESLNKWVNNYSFPSTHKPKLIGLISAGNIPLVSMHDLICILISGNAVQIKLSEKDTHLYNWIFSLIKEIDSNLYANIHIVHQLKNYDAVIATGGTLAANQFKYYFQHKPNIIRGHRNSIAVLGGEEDDETIKAIGQDIFSYYGMGCRNVSKILVPVNFNFDHFLNILDKEFDYVRNHYKFQNNYDYQLALYLLNKVKFLQGQSILLLEHSGIASPLACLYFEHYQNKEDVYQYILKNRDFIQCVISAQKIGDQVVTAPGMAQYPGLSDYADMNDTMNFLLQL